MMEKWTWLGRVIRRVFPEREISGADFDVDGLRYCGSLLRRCDWIGGDLVALIKRVWT